MASRVTLLLGVAVFLEQRIWAHCGSLAQPAIWAVPGSVIPKGSSVTIFCRIPQRVTQIRLTQVDPPSQWFDQTVRGAQEVAEFPFTQVTHSNAGLYYCEYEKQGYWSDRSDILKFVVTGVYKEKPSLIVQSGPQAGSGGIVTLICHIPHFYSFILCRDRGASFPQNCSQQDNNTFVISLVSPLDGGTYRCYGSGGQMSYLWSQPSEPLELSIKGPPGHLGIWISIAVACLLFFLLLLLLLIWWCRHRAKRGSMDETKSHVKYISSSPAMNMEEENQYDKSEDIQFKEHGHVETQLPTVEDPQEVTYAQLHHETLMRNMDPLPSSDLQDSSTQPCIYATLTMS